MAAGDLCALADVRTQLELDADETSRDTLISALIPHASLLIQQDLEREIATTGTNPFKRTFPFSWGDRTSDGTVLVDLAPYDLQSATLVRLNPEESTPVTLTADTDYSLRPQISAEGVYTSIRLSRYLVSVSQLALRFGEPHIEITGTWGFPSVPADVTITCAQVIAAWIRRDIPSLGMSFSELEPTPPATAATFDLPLFARRNLNRYRRNVGAF